MPEQGKFITQKENHKLTSPPKHRSKILKILANWIQENAKMIAHLLGLWQEHEIVLTFFNMITMLTK